MRVAIIAGLMAVGLLAGCGGAEEMNETASPGEQGQVEQGVTRWECVNACDQLYYDCIYKPQTGPKPTPQWVCESNRQFCISQCPAS
jgi:hypothetical protein